MVKVKGPPESVSVIPAALVQRSDRPLPVNQTSLHFLEFTAGFVTFSLGGLGKALALTRILTLATAVGCRACAMSFAGIATHALPHGLSSPFVGGIYGYWCGHEQGCSSCGQNGAFGTVFAIHTESSFYINKKTSSKSSIRCVT
jgi:hypothetical protein